MKVRACVDLIIQFVDEDVFVSNVGGGGGQFCFVFLDCGFEYRLFFQDFSFGYFFIMLIIEECLEQFGFNDYLNGILDQFFIECFGFNFCYDYFLF